MRKAIELSIENVANGGGPFGAVIAKNGEIIATGVNRVTASCAVMKSIPPVNPVLCVWALYIGHDWIRCIMPTIKRMQKI